MHAQSLDTMTPLLMPREEPVARAEPIQGNEYVVKPVDNPLIGYNDMFTTPDVCVSDDEDEPDIEVLQAEDTLDESVVSEAADQSIVRRLYLLNLVQVLKYFELTGYEQ